ncbi:hypothetical protein D3218_15830 [Aureimonas flava]|uniref:Uncharacterized protein n=1 Tax=Aureimonas flava TaxID=2320271 RepID=A0A3A1WJN4_9HYPH|nr:hypothetical protein [Aureimonas flava]RIX99234.1 hypothetical protein D3218_15830 [Aureimonas flava]
MPTRRALFLAAALGCLAVPALAAQDRILRVEGALTARTYPGLEAFLSNSVGTIVGLDIRADADQEGLSASTDGGRFVAYRPGSGSETEIVADGGFGFQHGAVTLEGFFSVKDGGMNQGIVSLFLERQPDASIRLSDTPVKAIRIDRLDPRIRKQD